MAKARKLKVFRTPIGFHDAYVAAPSMKAALAAWGAESNLFAQGIAEAVTDPRLIKEPLANPGEVIRLARGSAGEHLKAVETAAKKASGSRTKSGMTREKAAKPDRAGLDSAEERLTELDRAHRAELRAIDRAEAELDRRRRQAERRHAADREEAVARRDKAKRAYDKAMKAWRT